MKMKLLFLLLLSATFLLTSCNAKDVSADHDRPINQGQRRAIINGDAVDYAGEYPYFVNLYFTYEDDYNNKTDLFFCGGSLVAKDIVLSAAHCQVFVGDIARIGRYDQDTWTEDLEIVEVRNHPDYMTATLGLGFGLLSVMDNDVTVLKLNASSTAPVVTLNDDPDIPADDQELVVIGFGDTNITFEGVETPDVLHEVTVNHLSDETCIDLYHRYFITNDMLCAADEANDEDSCQGDSGGPILLTKTATPDDDVQVGIVSWGRGCAVEGFPGVYSKVSYHFDYIHAQIMSMSDDPPSYLASLPVTEWQEPTRYWWLNTANWTNPFYRPLVTKSGLWVGGMLVAVVGIIFGVKWYKKASDTPVDNTTIANETTPLV